MKATEDAKRKSGLTVKIHNFFDYGSHTKNCYVFLTFLIDENKLSRDFMRLTKKTTYEGNVLESFTIWGWGDREKRRLRYIKQ